MGDFGGNLSVRKVSRPNQQRTHSKMGISKTAISEMGGITQHTLLRVVGTISGCSVGRGNTEKLRGVAKLFNYESNQEN